MNVRMRSPSASHSESIGCVTAILNALAGDESEADAGPVLTEIVGVQLLLMNVLKPIAIGQPLTATAFDSLVAEVHKLKQSVARKLVQEK